MSGELELTTWSPEHNVCAISSCDIISALKPTEHYG